MVLLGNKCDLEDAKTDEQQVSLAYVCVCIYAREFVCVIDRPTVRP